jgi:hypothetical protein
LKRLKYLSADWPVALQTVGASIKTAPFSEETGDGFVLERVRSSSLEGRYFEKIVVNEVVEDPFGQTLAYERVTYREVHFKFSKAYPEIEILNPPRSLKMFFNRVAALLDFKVAFESLIVEPVQWVANIKNSNDFKASVQSIEVSGLAIDKDTTARFALVSQQDVLATAEKLIAKRAHYVEKVTIKIESDLGLYSLQLSADGAIRMADEIPAELVDVVRLAMPKSTIPSA